MHHFNSAPPVVVGIDGSPDASSAALWAVDEAASRDVPLKLVHVIHRADLLGTGTGDQLATAHAALCDARRAVEETAATVRVETEVLWGNPLAALIGLSRSATMVCAGSVGIQNACHGAGSTAAALAGSARCPVAVIHRTHIRHRADASYIVADVDASSDNSDVLGWAMSEARLRHAPLRITISCESQLGATADRGRLAREQLSRRIDRWTRLYPDVTVEPIVMGGSVARYLADSIDSVRLLVSGTRDRRRLGGPGGAGGCSVLTVGGRHP